MIIKKIVLKNFRNYEEESFILNPNKNIIYGDNAQGKTNILEAIFLCSLARSFRTKKDNELIKIGKDNASIEIEYQKSDRDGKIKLEISNNKSYFVNGIKVKKLSDVLGNIYVVLFNPNDIEILREGPEQRRRFLNIMISQLKKSYVYYMNNYVKTLEQRNSYLRQIKVENKSEELLEIWDEKLAEYGQKIYEYRNEFIEKIKEKINLFHEPITDEKEKIDIIYKSDCKDKQKYLENLLKNRKLDISRGYTLAGSHKDDFTISINGKTVKSFGSQGQQRTAIISLKLAELEVIYDEIGEFPILLLDDFMSELDKKRIQNFLNRIHKNQVIITCTDKINIQDKNCSFFQIENGKIKNFEKNSWNEKGLW